MERSDSKRVMVRSGRSALSARKARMAEALDAELLLDEDALSGMKAV